jgi:putative transposase
VRSIKDECLRRVIPSGEGHLRRTIAQYVEHYHRERNHQGISNELIAGAPAAGTVGRIRRRPRLVGLLNYYYRAAMMIAKIDPTARLTKETLRRREIADRSPLD